MRALEDRSVRVRGRRLVTAALAVLIPPGPVLGQIAGARVIPEEVRLIPNDTLHDLALTTVEGGRQIIYYNPALLAYVGPRLTRFFLAHEYGHVASGHSGGAMGLGESGGASGRRAQELEADCFAATRLAVNDPDAVQAAIRFFTITGAFRFDDLHPSGTERATRIAACASTVLPAEAWGPVTIAAAPVSVTVSAWEANVWIDHVPVGTVSNARVAAGSLTVRSLEPGLHEYMVVLRSYYLDDAMQLVPGGVVEGSGTVEVEAGGALVVDWRPGESPRVVGKR